MQVRFVSLFVHQHQILRVEFARLWTKPLNQALEPRWNHSCLPRNGRVPCQRKVKFDCSNVSQITLVASKVQTRGSIYESFVWIGMASGPIWDRITEKKCGRAWTSRTETVIVNQNRTEWSRIGPEWPAASKHNTQRYVIPLTASR